MSARANRVTEAYVAECATPDSRLCRALAEIDVPETMRAAWPRLLPRPVMVDEAEFRAFGRDLATIFDLVTSLPERCFDGDFERFRAALGIDEAWRVDAPAARRRPRRCTAGPTPTTTARRSSCSSSTSAARSARLDMVGPLPQAYLRIPAVAEFAAEHGLATWT